MRIEPRTAWNARPPKSVTKIAPTPRLYLHHSVTGIGPIAQVLRQIQAYHMDGRGWQDFAYSFAVDVAGRAWTGRGPLVAGGHTSGYNTTSHAVVAIGNFQTTDPTDALLEGLAQIAAHGYRAGWWTCRGYTGGHRMVARTACPGDRLNAQIPAINRRVEQLLSGTAKPAKPAPSPSPSPGGLTMSEAARLDRRIDTMRNATLLLVEDLNGKVRDTNRRIDTLRDATRLIVTAEGQQREGAVAEIEEQLDEHRAELDEVTDALERLRTA